MKRRTDRTMSSRNLPWERLLGQVTKKTQESVLTLTTEGNQGLVVGTGASGDKTLLADLRAEEELSRELLRIKGVRILSEEAGDIGDPANRTLAIIDPLDGSSNFERGIPFYCTSVAIAEGHSVRGIRIAMVRNLINGDVYFAGRGEGASKNGKRILTTKEGKLSESVVGVDLSGISSADMAELVPLLVSAKRIVHYGANALELCLLAEGKIDAFVDVRRRMRVTDLAGGYLIAREAGATISLAGAPQLTPRISLKSRFSLVASANVSLHQEILRRFHLKR